MAQHPDDHHPVQPDHTASTVKTISSTMPGMATDQDQLLQLQSLKYMQQTRLSRNQIRNFSRPKIQPTAPFKQYTNAQRIPLPRDWPLAEARLSSLLQRRRSRRNYGGTPLTLNSLGYMLWAGQGVTALAGNHPLRTAPSAGALYPIETYLFVNNIEELPAGLYHFNVADFELEVLKTGNLVRDLATTCLNQQFLTKAAVVFAWTAIYRRNACKYGERGLRYVLIDAGHICQNILLAAEATGACGCPVAAFFDEELNELLGIDGEEESAIYLAGVGPKV